MKKQYGGASTSADADREENENQEILPLIQSALKRNLTTHGIKLPENEFSTMEEVMIRYKDVVVNTIRKLLQQKPIIKLHLSGHVTFVLPGATPVEEENSRLVPVSSTSYVVLRGDQSRLPNLVRQMFASLARSIENYLNVGSGFVVRSIVTLRLLSGALSFVGHGRRRRSRKKQNSNPYIVDEAEDVIFVDMDSDSSEPETEPDETLEGFIVPDDDVIVIDSDDDVVFLPQNPYMIQTETLVTQERETVTQDIQNSEETPFMLHKSELNKLEQKYVLSLPCPPSQCFLVSLAVLSAGAVLWPLSERKKLELFVDRFLKNQMLRVKKNWGAGMDVKNIKKFEKLNADPEGRPKVRINVFMFQKNHNSFPVHVTPPMKMYDSKILTANLLMVRYRGEYHYLPILDLDKFFSGPRNWYRVRHCPNCVQGFSNLQGLINHQELCFTTEKCKVIMPKENTILKFSHFKCLEKRPYVIFADFEAALVAPEEPFRTNTILQVNEHKPVAFSILVIDWEGKIVFRKTLASSTECMDQFFRTLDYIEKLLKPNWQKYAHDMIEPEEEIKRRLMRENKCCICKDHFDFMDGSVEADRVVDHNHYTGEFRGYAHRSCNVKKCLDYKLPIYIHNLANYDSAFLLHYIDRYKGCKDKIQAIPLNKEKFRCLKFGNLHFLDSLQLIPGSLAQLVKDLIAMNHTFPILKQTLMGDSEERLQTSIRKGVFPYELMDSLERMENMDYFPPIEAFYSSLQKSGISQEEWDHGKKVWDLYNFDTMSDYMKHYVDLDCQLLAEVVTTVRDGFFQDFEMDVTHFISLPAFSYMTSLRHLKHEVQLLSDPDMLLLCERSIRGGLSFVSTRHVKIPQEQLDKPALDQTENLLYVDANALYPT